MPYTPEHKRRTRQRIVGAAARLFNRNGFAEVTIGEIMAAAGLTHGGFYRHFAGKEELYAEAVRHFLRKEAPARWQKRRAGAPAGPAVRALRGRRLSVARSPRRRRGLLSADRPVVRRRARRRERQGGLSGGRVVDDRGVPGEPEGTRGARSRHGAGRALCRRHGARPRAGRPGSRRRPSRNGAPARPRHHGLGRRDGLIGPARWALLPAPHEGMPACPIFSQSCAAISRPPTGSSPTKACSMPSAISACAIRRTRSAISCRARARPHWSSPTTCWNTISIPIRSCRR